MNCANHPEAAVAAYCRTCGKPLCSECKREADGTIFCADHVPVASAAETEPPNSGAAAPPNEAPVYGAPAYTSPYTSALPPGPAPATATSPVLALVLGLIPGVGAIYNGQYAKGLIHAVIFGILVSIVDSHRLPGMEPLIGILISAWVFYMAFEAYHTAKARRDGRRPEELSSLVQIDRASGRLPVAALVLIAIGGLLLLDTTNLISIERLFHLWPVGLILIGVYMLYERMGPNAHANASQPAAEARDDRR